MGSNILIVEDHELTRFGLKTAFETTDFVDSLFEAESAETGIEIIQDNKKFFGSFFQKGTKRKSKKRTAR